MTDATAATKPRNRIVEFRMVKAKDLHLDPRNFRLHPGEQMAALEEGLADLGWTDVVKARFADGKLVIWDGHARRSRTKDPDEEIPTIITDLNEEESRKALATHDAIGSMAAIDRPALQSLLLSVNVRTDALRSLLDGMADRFGALKKANAPIQPWRPMWQGMPSYKHDDLEPKFESKVCFRDANDIEALGKLIGQNLTESTRSFWFPKAAIMSETGSMWKSDRPQNPKYPIYIPSRGRASNVMTAKALDAIGVPYLIVTETDQEEEYRKYYPPEKLLIIPLPAKRNGAVPARNAIWEHACSTGAARHWQLDDNIRKFYRYEANNKLPVGDGTIFRIAEDFTDRFENVAQSGFQYHMFVMKKKGDTPPVRLNTRIYSCTLNRNDLYPKYAYRGPYNDDTDLSLRVLKDGMCTILFNAFLCQKMATLTMKGGMADLYTGSGRALMAEQLRVQHPDVCTVSTKWGRVQHQVDYRPFRGNAFVPVAGLRVIQGDDDYGMRIVPGNPGDEPEEAPAAEGPTVEVSCPACGAISPVGADIAAVADRAPCPSCGEIGLDLIEAGGPVATGGDRTDDAATACAPEIAASDSSDGSARLDPKGDWGLGDGAESPSSEGEGAHP